MTTMNVVEPRLSAFIERMRAKLALPKNQEKGDWRNLLDSYSLLQLLKKEVKELEDAIIIGSNDQIVGEAADVANFAMMIADWWGASIPANSGDHCIHEAFGGMGFVCCQCETTIGFNCNKCEGKTSNEHETKGEERGEQDGDKEQEQDQA